MPTYYRTHTDTPPDTDSAVFSLLWEDIRRALDAHPAAADRMDTGLVPGWLCREVSPGSDEWETTAEGWAYAAALCLGWRAGPYHVPEMKMESHGEACGTWRRAVARGVEVAARIVNEKAA